MLDDLRVNNRIQSCSGYDLLEQPCIDSAGTRERDQQSAWAQKFECQ
jgi:hypothetical protein